MPAGTALEAIAFVQFVAGREKLLPGDLPAI
jgi:hypothetical protein